MLCMLQAAARSAQKLAVGKVSSVEWPLGDGMVWAGAAIAFIDVLLVIILAAAETVRIYWIDDATRRRRLRCSTGVKGGLCPSRSFALTHWGCRASMRISVGMALWQSRLDRGCTLGRHLILMCVRRRHNTLDTLVHITCLSLRYHVETSTEAISIIIYDLIYLYLHVNHLTWSFLHSLHNQFSAIITFWQSKRASQHPQLLKQHIYTSLLPTTRNHWSISRNSPIFLKTTVFAAFILQVWIKFWLLFY